MDKPKLTIRPIKPGEVTRRDEAQGLMNLLVRRAKERGIELPERIANVARKYDLSTDEEATKAEEGDAPGSSSIPRIRIKNKDGMEMRIDSKGRIRRRITKFLPEEQTTARLEPKKERIVSDGPTEEAPDFEAWGDARSK